MAILMAKLKLMVIFKLLSMLVLPMKHFDERLSIYIIPINLKAIWQQSGFPLSIYFDPTVIVERKKGRAGQLVFQDHCRSSAIEIQTVGMPLRQVRGINAVDDRRAQLQIRRQSERWGWNSRQKARREDRRDRVQKWQHNHRVATFFWLCEPPT